MQRRRFNNRNVVMKVTRCGCGGEAKLKTRRNFTHGVKSTALSIKYYFCNSCGKRSVLTAAPSSR